MEPRQRAEALTAEVKAIILCMHAEGFKSPKIAKLVGSKPSTIRMFLLRHREVANMLPKEKKSRRKISSHVGWAIKMVVRINPRIYVQAICEAVAKLLKWNVNNPKLPSKSTIHCFLKLNNLHAMKLAMKPLISEKNQRRRFHFGVEFKDMPKAFFDRILWSDETFIRSRPNKQVQYYRVHPSAPRSKNPFNYQVSGGGFGVMFWGCFSSFAFGPLVVCEGHMDADFYMEIIRDFVVHEIRAGRRKFGVELIYMQDNAPCHKAKKSMAFMA
jgi:hypothetical protein